jgi:alpha-glucosidase (family GH31 glycosyl hydrolase)
MRQFVDKLHADGQHWAPIFNPGISVQPGYRAYEEGNARGIWIKDVNGNPYKGQVGPHVLTERWHYCPANISTLLIE